jgi:phosphonate transport system substrate-binding protein
MITRRLSALLLVLVLGLAACSTPPAATPTEAPAEPTAAPTAEAAATTAPTEAATEAATTAATTAADSPTAAAPAAGDLGSAENPIVMSFVPSGDSQEIIASGEEIAAMLSEMTGLTITANVATSYAAVVEAMGAGNAQVGWLNTFGYVLANERYGVEVSLATLRFGEPFYTGQIVANADSGISELADIAGKKMCYVDPLSTSGYIIPRLELAAAGVDVEALESQDAGSHPNVITAVYNGDCDAGATYVDARTAVAEELPDVNDKVLVIAESSEIPNDTVAFASDVPEEIRTQIVEGLLEIAETDEGKAALEQVYEIEGFTEVDDSFYDEFRTVLDASGINIEDLAGE